MPRYVHHGCGDPSCTDPEHLEVRALLRVRSSRDGDEFVVEVREVERRVAFGRTDVLVTPVAGEGQLWVHESRLQGTTDQMLCERCGYEGHADDFTPVGPDEKLLCPGCEEELT